MNRVGAPEYSVESHQLHCSEIRRMNSAVTIDNRRPILDVELTEERFSSDKAEFREENAVGCGQNLQTRWKQPAEFSGPRKKA